MLALVDGRGDADLLGPATASPRSASRRPAACRCLLTAAGQATRPVALARRAASARAAAKRRAARSTATVAAKEGPESGGPGAADAAPRAAQKSPAEPSPVNPVVAPAPAGLPPDPRLTWAAEIEWRRIDDESRFCVIARGAGTVEIAQSPPLDWPPDGPAAVQAVTDAADDLAATLVAAGWTPAAARRTPGTPSGSPGSLRLHGRVTDGRPPRPCRTGPRAPVAAPCRAFRAQRGAARARPSRRSRAKQVVVLGVLAAVGLIAALQFGGGSDEPTKPSAPSGDDHRRVGPLLGLCCRAPARAC